MNEDSEPDQPSQDDVFAASPPFTSAAGFVGIDAWHPDGPRPIFSPLAASAEATCSNVHSSLSVYLDGELAPSQAAAVEAHVASCPSCQHALAFQSQLRSTVATKALDPMPDGVRDRITRALGFDESL